MIINVKMPTIVGILTFMSKINFVLRWVGAWKKFYNLWPRHSENILVKPLYTANPHTGTFAKKDPDDRPKNAAFHQDLQSSKTEVHNDCTVKTLMFFCWWFWFDSLGPINNLSVIKGRVFLGWTSTKLGLMFLLKDTKQWRQWRPWWYVEATCISLQASR